jgi:8-oxo-dGTP diphosphatase
MDKVWNRSSTPCPFGTKRGSSNTRGHAGCRCVLLISLQVPKSRSRTKISSNLEHRNKKANDIHEGKWNGLGGKFEAGKTPEEYVVREVLEASGLAIQNPKLCGLLIFPKFKGNDWYVFVFTTNEFTGELIDSPEGRLEWIPDEKLRDLNLWDSDHISFHGSERENSFLQNSNMKGLSCSDIKWSSIHKAFISHSTLARCFHRS